MVSSLLWCGGILTAASGVVDKAPAKTGPVEKTPPILQKAPVRNVAVFKEPVLVNVNPQRGSPGDKVVISGNNLPTDMSLIDVWFVLDREVKAKKLKVTPSKNFVSYEVQVPATDELSAGFSGKIYMKFVGAAEGSNALRFLFFSHPPPTITSPSKCKSGNDSTTLVTLYGVNFRPDDEVHCVDSRSIESPKPDIVLTKQYVSTTQVTVSLSSFDPPPAFAYFDFYIVAKYPGVSMRGPSYALTQESTGNVESKTKAKKTKSSGGPEQH